MVKCKKVLTDKERIALGEWCKTHRIPVNEKSYYDFWAKRKTLTRW